VKHAVELLEESLREDPRFVLAHAALGEAYWDYYGQSMDTQWTVKALSSLTEALRLEPDQADVRRRLAKIYRGTGRNEAALEELRLALQAESKNSETHQFLGEVLFDLGRQDEALQCFEEAIRLRPNFWRNHMEFGRARYHMGQYERAVESFSRVVDLQPDNAWGYHMLGTAYNALGKTELALANYKRSMDISPSATAAANVGTILYGKGNYQEALQSYDLAIRLKPKAPYYRNRGDVYRKLGDHEKARQSYERAVQLTEELIRVNPKDAEALSRLAVYEAKLGRFEIARRRAGEACALERLDVEIAYRRAVVHALGGDLAESANQLKQAVDNGFSFFMAQQDDDLEELRKSSHFTALFPGSIAS
jgi:tetratricopeptide (TPR) repeat protein